MKCIIAIDPDCEKSGVVCLNLSERKFDSLDSFTFPQLLSYLEIFKQSKDVFVIVEAGWLNSGNWHFTKFDSKAKAAALGNAVGRNHETGRKIVEMCKHYGLDVREVSPFKKIWKGKDRKITHAEISEFIPGLPARTNQEERDAALLAWVHAGYSIQIMPKLKK